MKNHSTTRKGFTAIEVMIVVVLIAIMAAVAVPSIRAWVPRQQVRSVKRDIVSKMQLGRMRAIGSGSYFFIDFDHNNNASVAEGMYTCYLDTDNDGADGEVNNANGDNEYNLSRVTLTEQDAGVRVIPLPNHVSFGVDTGVPAAPNSDSVGDGVAVLNDRIELHPDGRARMNASGNQPTVYIRSDREENFAIQVNMLGQVNVLKWNGAAWQ
jgi:prepilin-type N-terminal cleavage/methylation domain-containing protein